MDLLFLHGHWHGLAKLQMHHDITLEIFDAETRSLGEKLCDFSTKTCAAFDTIELCREQQAHLCREARNESSHGRQNAPANASVPHLTPHSSRTSSNSANLDSLSQGVQQPQSTGGSMNRDLPICINSAADQTQPQGSNLPTRGGRRHKKLNINTYKFHLYGDYPNTIREYGTTDSYSTESVRHICNTKHISASDIIIGGRARTSISKIKV